MASKWYSISRRLEPSRCEFTLFQLFYGVMSFILEASIHLVLSINRNPPASGVAAESPTEDATQFEQWVDWAAKYDSGYFNVTSLWAKFRQPAGTPITAVYYHTQRGVFTFKVPLEGVQDEQVTDPAQWAGYIERATQHDSNLELNAMIDVDGRRMACAYGSGPAGR